MSRTHHHGQRKIRKWQFWRQPWNKEWWAARPYRYHSPSKHNNWWFKRALSKAERRLRKLEAVDF